MIDGNTLFEFLEGNLTPEKENELFFRLSVDDELRENLKMQLAIDRTLLNSKSYFMPSAQSTMKVFGEIGFRNPVGRGGTLFSLPKAGEMISRYSQGIKAGSVVSLLFILSYMVFLSGPDPRLADTAGRIADKDISLFHIPGATLSGKPLKGDRKDVPALRQASGAGRLAAKSTQIRKRAIPLTESRENTASPRNSAMPENIKVTYVQAESVIPRSEEENRGFAKFMEEKDTQKKKAVSKMDESPAGLQSGLLDDGFGILRLSNPNIRILNLGNKSLGKMPSAYSGWALEMRNTPNWNIENSNITNDDISPINNIAIALMKNIGNSFKFGIEVRQETFYQKFRGKEEEDLDITYEQQPNFTTLGVAARYGFDILRNVEGFAQAGFGLSRGGTVPRAMAGFVFKPFGLDLSVVAGIEYSNLFYKHQGVGYNSAKWGFNYGLSYNF